jgi:hypothetical protein
MMDRPRPIPDADHKLSSRSPSSDRHLDLGVRSEHMGLAGASCRRQHFENAVRIIDRRWHLGPLCEMRSGNLIRGLPNMGLIELFGRRGCSAFMSRLLLFRREVMLKIHTGRHRSVTQRTTH